MSALPQSYRWADIDVHDGGDDTEDEIGGTPTSFLVLPSVVVRQSRNADEDKKRTTSTYSRECEPDARSWLPNAAATEFIPTLTMECPLVGVIQISTEDGQVTDGVAAFELFSPAPASQRLAYSKRPAKISIPIPRPPTRDQRKMKTPVLTKVGPACTEDQNVMPEASEEVWQHRADQRQRDIRVVKEAPEYQRHIARKALDGCDEGEPLTPNPFDRTLSKRRWKFSLQQWRKQTGDFALDDDCQSMMTATTETGGDASSSCGDCA